MEWLRTQKGGAEEERRDKEYFRSAAILSGGALGRAKTLLFAESDASEIMQQRDLAMTILNGIFTGKTSDFLVSVQTELPKSRETAAAAMMHVQTALRDLIVRKKNAQVPMLFFTGTEEILPQAGRYALSRLTALYQLTERTCARIQANGSLHASLAAFAMEARRI